MAPRFQREAYTIGWVCALPVELAAAQEMLDEEHENLEQDGNDSNLYSLGSISGHKVVLACLPAGQTGNNSAAAVAMQMKASFKGIRFGLMVGVGGGVPSEEVDIRLGDVVVSQPVQAFGGVVQYDFGKATPSGFERTGHLNAPPPILLNAVAKMQAKYHRRRSNLHDYVRKLSHVPEFTRTSAGPDILFEATYNHVGGRTCEACSADKRVTRQPEEREEVVVHYGTIASGNEVMRDGTTRDTVSAGLGGVLCFEMEAAGLMNTYPCLVIRGICDYADSHKNKRWQSYAAVTAAAYAKELLEIVPECAVLEAHPVISQANKILREGLAGQKRRLAHSTDKSISQHKRARLRLRDEIGTGTSFNHDLDFVRDGFLEGSYDGSNDHDEEDDSDEGSSDESTGYENTRYQDRIGPCYNCGLFGHYRAACTRREGKCYHCGTQGHHIRTCWKQGPNGYLR